MTRLHGWAPRGERARRQGPARPLEDRDVPRRSAQRPHRRALPVRRPDQRRALSRLCRAVPRPDPQARRRRDPRQSRHPQGKSGAQGHPSCRRPPRVPAEISRPQPHRAGLRQVQRLYCERPKREATRRSPTQAAKSSPSTRPPNAPHTSRTQGMGKAKCRRL